MMRPAAYRGRALNAVRPIRTLAALALVLLGISCKGIATINYREVPVTPQVQARKEPPLPLRVALYVPEAFLNFHFEIDQKGIANISSIKGWIDPGRPLAIALYQGACGAFDHAYFLEAFTPGQAVPDRDTQLVVVPRIERFEFRAARNGYASNVVVVRLHTAVYDGEGRERFQVEREVERKAGMFGSMLGSGPFNDVKRICDEACGEAVGQTLDAIRAQGAAGGS